MITKNDCLILLAELQNNGIETNSMTKLLMNSPTIPEQVLKFINDNRQLDLSRFYEKLRKSYNNKKSSLYINIVKDIEDPNQVLVTLSSLLLQILLFSKDADDKIMFLKHARANEISKVLNLYFTTYSLENCIKLLRIIKADLKALESIK